MIREPRPKEPRPSVGPVAALRTWPAALTAALTGLCLAAAPARGQIRIVNYNVAQLNGNQTSLEDVFEALNADDKPGFAVAPALYVFQEVNSADVGPLLTRLNAAAPPGISYTQGTFTINTPPNTNENGSAGAQAMFYRGDILTEDVAGHVDISTGAGRNGDRWRLLLVGYDSPAASFYIYSCHLKASQGGSEQQQRLAGATAIRDNSDAIAVGTNIIYAGDFNVYVNTEPAYLEFLSAGNGQALDPLGTGSWAGSGNAIKHSQAPCATGCALVSGGMDDRFDFQLSTAVFQDGEGLALMPGTYRSFGNDGNHYDTDINAGNNSYYPADIPRSNALADDLKVASDHVPVVADYQIPAVLSATMPPDFGRVIQGAGVVAEVSIENAADVLVVLGADELDYDVVASGVLAGSTSGSLAALAGPEVVQLTVDTSIIGNQSGTAQVTSSSQAVQGSPVDLPISGQVLRHSNASFSAISNEDAAETTAYFSVDTGVHDIPVQVHNFNFAASQALLDIDAVIGLSSPFSLAGALPTGIGADPGLLALSIDTTGLSPGIYVNQLDVQVSDEDIPGETTANLSLTLRVVVPLSNPDVDCDGDVDFDDVTAFAGVLLGVDTEQCHVDRSDFDFSTQADGTDMPFFLDVFLDPP